MEPTFGPPFAESRINGYDPVKGMLNIQYRFSYNVYAGGQRVNTKVIFICDSSEANNQYCPDGYYESINPLLRTDLRTYTTTVPKGGSKSETITLYDKQSQYWFNKMRIEHTYTIDGVSKTKIQEFPIGHKGELFSACNFDGGILGQGAGIVCDAIYTGDSTLSAYQLDRARTSFIPSDTFYPGNLVKLNLGYKSSVNAQDNQQTSFDLAYKAVCRGAGGVEAVGVGFTNVNNLENTMGTEEVSLFEIPPLGTGTNEKTYVYTLDNVVTQATNYCMELATSDVNQVITISSIITNGFSFNDNENNNKMVSGTSKVDIIVSDSGAGKSFSFETKTQNEVNIKLTKGKCDTSSRSNVGAFSRTEKQIDSNTLDKLQKGPCTLYLKSMPVGDGRKIITSTDFDNYKLALSNFTSEADLYEISLNFNVDEIDTSNPQSSFMFTNIENGGTLCVNDNDKNGGYINLDYTYSTNVEGTVDKFSVESIGASNIATQSQFIIGDNNQEIQLSGGNNKHLILKFPAVDTASSSQNRFEEHLFGGIPDKRAEITINYEIKRYEDGRYVESNSKKDSIKFYLNFNSNCGDGSDLVNGDLTSDNIKDALANSQLLIT